MGCDQCDADKSGCDSCPDKPEEETEGEGAEQEAETQQ